MTADSVRHAYIDFFVAQRHVAIPSAPIALRDDPTTLFTSSGMQALVPYLLGQEHSVGKRIVNSQKCIRTQDIEEVGDNRHTTFFEMLGNWSLGDYFKKEQLPWFFSFLTKTLALPPEKLYVTFFEGNSHVPKDQESLSIWQELFAGVGIDAKEGERIFAYPAKKNWWSRAGEPEHMPAGEPGGPDSEVFFDFGTPHDVQYGDHCHPNCDCGRFLEIGNSVFMEYKKQSDGSLVELSQKNVDFGGGLERMVAATNNESDIFRTDLFAPLIDQMEEATGKSYADSFSQAAMRIIADHLKAATFLLSEGVVPANKEQGYVLRRLIRRSVVKIHQLGVSANVASVASSIVTSVGKMYEKFYPDLSSTDPQFSSWIGILNDEVSRFEKNLVRGLKILEAETTVTGKTAFDLHQTYGFPWELTVELAAERGQTIDREEIKQEFARHQEISRQGSDKRFQLDNTANTR